MVLGLETEAGAEEPFRDVAVCLCCGRAVAQPHEGMPWLLGSLLTLAVPSAGRAQLGSRWRAPGCDHTSICPRSSCLGAGSSLAGKEPSTPCLVTFGNFN